MYRVREIPSAFGWKSPIYNSDLAWIPFEVKNMQTGLLPEDGKNPKEAAWLGRYCFLSFHSSSLTTLRIMVIDE